MSKLKLNFLDKNSDPHNHPVVQLLEEFGREITNYAKEYFFHIVTSSSSDEVFLSAALYIIVPEINTQYNIIDISLEGSVTQAKVIYIPFLTSTAEVFTVDISQDYSQLESKISELLTSRLAVATYRHLVTQVEIKRDALKGF